MATVESMQASEPVEAVIISGPRKGDIIRLAGDDIVLTPEEEKAFDELQAALDRAVQSAREAVRSTRSLRQELHELVRSLSSGTT